MLLNLFIISSGGFGKDINKRLNLEMIKVFKIVILPKGGRVCIINVYVYMLV